MLIEFDADYQITHQDEIPEGAFVTVGYLEAERVRKIEVEAIKAKGRLDTRKSEAPDPMTIAKDRAVERRRGIIFSA